MSTENIKRFYSQNSEQRYDVVIAEAKAQGKLWTLADDQGCVIVESGKDEQCLVVWHDEAIAADWAQNDFEGCRPLAISLEDFIAKWAPGMTQDGFEVAVAPSLAGEGIVVAPQELADDLA